MFHPYVYIHAHTYIRVFGLLVAHLVQVLIYLCGVPGEHHTGMSYLFYYTEQNAKHKRGKNYKQRFWINTPRLPFRTNSMGVRGNFRASGN